MKDHSDHFGVPEENIRAAQLRVPGTRGSLHSSVPTKRDIATLSPTELMTALIAWMEHSAIEIVPSRAQISLVRDALREREDAAELAAVIRMCTNYIEGG